MTTIGCPKCGKKEGFGINVTSSLEKNQKLITKNDLMDMKPGTFIIWCNNCSHKITDIKEII
jgi:hypothetical protein